MSACRKLTDALRCSLSAGVWLRPSGTKKLMVGTKGGAVANSHRCHLPNLSGSGSARLSLDQWVEWFGGLRRCQWCRLRCASESYCRLFLRFWLLDDLGRMLYQQEAPLDPGHSPRSNSLALQLLNLHPH